MCPSASGVMEISSVFENFILYDVNYLRFGVLHAEWLRLGAHQLNESGTEIPHCFPVVKKESTKLLRIDHLRSGPDLQTSSGRSKVHTNNLSKRIVQRSHLSTLC